MRNPLFLVINEEVFDDRLIFWALNYMWSVILDVLIWPQIEALVKLPIESMVCEFFYYCYYAVELGQIWSTAL